MSENKTDTPFSQPSQSGFLSSGFDLSQSADSILLQVSTRGATSDTYKSFSDGHYRFVKKLKREFICNHSYRDVFRKEYEIGKALDCEYIPRYIYYSEDNHVPTITMEYVDGMTLDEFIKQKPKYFSRKSNRRRFLLQLIEGLSVLHTHQIVHLDLKPQNIMLTSVNNDVRIIDLGYCYSDSVPFLKGMTTPYAAPEQKTSGQRVDARTDIYGLGKIIEYVLRHSNAKDRTLLGISKKCLQENPSRRYQNVREIRRELSSALWRNRVVLAFSFLMLLAGAMLATYSHYVNDYDLNVEIESLNSDIYFNYVNSDKELEVTYKYTFGNTYPHDFAVPHEVSVDGRMLPVTSIGDSAFRKSELVAVTLPSTITRIGAEAFDCCARLSFLSVPDNVKELGFASFAGCSALKLIRLSRNIKEIPRSCFFDSGINAIDVPEGVTVIRQDAFVGCNNLKDVTLPSSLVTVERGAFYHCSSLETISIPENVTTLGDFVFWECPNLKTIYNNSVNPQICTGVVKDNFKGVIYVPAQSVDDYRKTSGWKGLNIQPMP